MFLRRALFGGVAVSSSALITHFLFKKSYSEEIYAEPLSTDYTAISNLPSRSQLLTQLKNDTFDLLIIGGGATGAGCAMDAATRGLKVAMVERDDFSAGKVRLLAYGCRHILKIHKIGSRRSEISRKGFFKFRHGPIRAGEGSAS